MPEVGSFYGFSKFLQRSLLLSADLSDSGGGSEFSLVFFHPEWILSDTPDGEGQSDAANYARRSPYPMINLLRTQEVRKGQEALERGGIYEQNRKTLDAVGTQTLARMLEGRDWSRAVAEGRGPQVCVCPGVTAARADIGLMDRTDVRNCGQRQGAKGRDSVGD